MSENSVVIPVYNAEGTINRCINSIVNQSIFEQMEIILINDGSKDSTLEILREYENKYTNIKVINVANCGPAKARNLGIQNLHSKYIGFVDSDDYIETDMYETMLKEMNQEVDLVCCERHNLYSDNSIKDSSRDSSETNPKKLDSTTAYVWDKLFKKDIIDKFDIEFPENLNYAEDFYFITLYKIHAKKMTILPNALYFYNINQSHSITNEYDERVLDIIKSLKKINEYFILNNMFEEYKDELLKCSAGFYVRRLSEFKKYKNEGLQKAFIKEFFEYFNEYFSDWKKVVNQYRTKSNKFYRTNKLLLNIYIAIHNL